MSEVYISDVNNSIVKRLKIYHNDDVITNPLDSTIGILDITFYNDVTVENVLLYSFNSLNSPPLMAPQGNPYDGYAIYYCDQEPGVGFNELCHGIALQFNNNRLCAVLFQYNPQSRSPIFTVNDIGCFHRSGFLQQPRLSESELSKLLKEAFAFRISRFPIPPHCLTCLPWKEYKHDLQDKLENLEAKRYQIEIQEIK